VELIESELLKPLHWKKPRVIALNWMGDLFHEYLLSREIDQVFAVMALCPQHKFIVLTKRAKRMREDYHNSKQIIYGKYLDIGLIKIWPWPLLNVGIGVSVEDREHLNRLDDLRQTPAALRWFSAEPLLGDLGTINLDGISWVICGGESGPGARPMHPDWVRSLRDQCQAEGVPFLFKQWGEHYPISRTDGIHELPFGEYNAATGYGFKRVGKRAAGRLLDGRTWDELPELLK
jgi:protein gp37